MNLVGGTSACFAIFSGPLNIGSFPYSIGQIDIGFDGDDINDLSANMVVFAALDPTGVATINLPSPSLIPIGSRLAYQGIIAYPLNPSIYFITAATEWIFE